ncbi:MAG: (d)CMP kinase [Acidimicrobiales bacterium]
MTDASQRRPVIAIDGPAGSGKSTVSRALSERLGLDRLDTGAMYRAVTWAALDRGLDPGDRAAVSELARKLDIIVADRVTADGTDVTEAIREADVNATVSEIAANPEVRAVLVEQQRRWTEGRDGAVVEGRDIGSVVLPRADLKVFLTASEDERARRRAEEGSEAMARRDRIDRTRTTSPLEIAEGARVLDTTGRSVDEIVEEVISWL